MQQIEAFIINHWDLWLALIIILFLIFINERLTQKKRPPMLSAAGLVELMNQQDAVVVDIRDKELFHAGHIINAIRASAEDFETERMKQYQDKPIVLVCTKGLQAESLALTLRNKGYKNIMVLNGGMNTWSQASMPLVKGK